MDNIKDKIKAMSKDNAKSLLNVAWLCLFAIEFLGTVGIYVALKTQVSQLWAELWMLIAFGYALKNEFNMLEPLILDKVLDTACHGENDGKKTKKSNEHTIAEDAAKD